MPKNYSIIIKEVILMNDLQNIQNNEAKLEPLGNVPLSKLPQRFQDHFDKTKTPEAEYFSVKSKTTFYWLVTGGMAFWFLVMFVQAFAASTKYNQIDNSWLVYNLMWSLPALFFLIIASYFAIRKESYANRVESGDLRIGLIIHPEALLVRTGMDSCYLIPRDWLTAVTIQRYLHGKGCWATKMVFTDIEGKDHAGIVGINTFGIFDYFDDNGKLPSALRIWNPQMIVRG